MSVYPFSSAYVHPAPVVQISLGTPGAAPSVGPLEALVDTGADATLVPISYLRQVGARKVDQDATLRSHWGERRLVSLYAVAFGVNQHQFGAVWVVGDDSGEDLILGRNMLNRLRLLLDGPAAMTEILDSTD